MSLGYKPVSWNKYKIKYDIFIWGCILLFLVFFIIINKSLFPALNPTTILIRGTGLLAILLLHIILVIGPLCRLSSRFLPLLYNRRHLGVSMFIIATFHAYLSITWFHGGGDKPILDSLFTSNIHYTSFIQFPFQILGFIALIILAAMAFTSHDFWQQFLGPAFWKKMHMLVYAAYAFLIMHVSLGVLQLEKSPVLLILLLTGIISISSLHLLAAHKEAKFDLQTNPIDADGWIYVCRLNEIEENRAKITTIQNERIAIFKYNGKISAVHNVCKHQLGPVGEGMVIDGCITCPWHGYQYKPEDGFAPSPFTEKLKTYNLKLEGDKIFVHQQALPEGSFVPPVMLPEIISPSPKPFFVGWGKQNDRKLLSWPLKFAFSISAIILLVSFTVLVSQQKISSFIIDYKKITQIEGWLTSDPVPMLIIKDGKDPFGNNKYKSILLVDALKHGALKPVSSFLNGKKHEYVMLRGYPSTDIISCSNSKDSAHNSDCSNICTECIYGTNNFPLIELENSHFSFTKKNAEFNFPDQLQNDSLTVNAIVTGEVIDPKCYFGAMNPGWGKPHNDCAIRCISGGIMPVLKYSADGIDKFAILLNDDGGPANKTVLNFTGMPVTISCKISPYLNWGLIYINPDGIKRN